MIKNKKDIKRLETLLNKIQKRITEFGEENFDQRIKEEWNRLKRKAGEDNLKKMPIDAISTLEKRMPINELVASGYRTIHDIKDQDAHDLMNIRGVGEKSAYTIVDSVSKIKDSVYKQAT